MNLGSSTVLAVISTAGTDQSIFASSSVMPCLALFRVDLFLSNSNSISKLYEKSIIFANMALNSLIVYQDLLFRAFTLASASAMASRLAATVCFWAAFFLACRCLSRFSCSMRA